MYQLAKSVREGKDGIKLNIKLCVLHVCVLGTAGLQWYWTWADNLFTVRSGEILNKCWVISARSNYPCRWQGECVSTPLHPRPCPEGWEFVRKYAHTYTRTCTDKNTAFTCGICSGWEWWWWWCWWFGKSSIKPSIKHVDYRWLRSF